MNANDSLIFAAVVDAGGFSAAARRLGIPKTTVSKRVSELEKSLGVRLLNRTTRSLSLTEAGARVHRHCSAAVEHLDAAVHEAKALQEEPYGTITLLAPPAVIATTLLAPVNAFLDRYPGIRLVVLAANDLDQFNAGKVDLAVWAAEATPAGHALRLVTTLNIGLFASRAYADRHGLPATADELTSHSVVAFTQTMQGDRFRWHLVNARGEQVQVSPLHAPRFASNDAMAVLAGILAGHGIGGLPLRFAAAMHADGELQQVLPNWTPPPLQLVALIRDGGSSSFAVRLFVDTLIGQLKASDRLKHDPLAWTT